MNGSKPPSAIIAGRSPRNIFDCDDVARTGREVGNRGIDVSDSTTEYRFHVVPAGP